MLGRSARWRPLAVGLWLLAVLAPFGAAAEVRQAPASRVALDLPTSYTPSRNFTGFLDESLGISMVILEMPAVAYEQLASGLTPEALATKGVRAARPGKLDRPDPYIYLRAEQDNPEGSFAKFMLALRDGSVTALITVNVPKAALDSGRVAPAAIERILASAAIAPAAAPARELYQLDYLGPFKPAGSVLGATRAYTLDGRFEPTQKGEQRAVLIVGPSLDRRRVPEPDAQAETLVKSLAGVRDVAITEKDRLEIAGMPAIVLQAAAANQDDGRAVAVFQVLVLPPAGGYYRFVAQIPAADRAVLIPELRKIAASFRPLE